MTELILDDLIKAKVKLRLTNRSLAKAARIHETTISSILHGRLKPNAEQVAILAAILDLNINERQTNG